MDEGRGEETVAEQELQVTVEVATGSSDAWPVVRISGEVDIQSSPVLDETLVAVLDQGLASVIVDLEEVSFLDSTGLSVLIVALKRCQKAGGDLRLRDPQPNVFRVLEITGLLDVFHLAGKPTGRGLD
jgi:anti-sigma B factor antagonist